MNRKNTYVNNMLISFIENWNDSNPKAKLTPEIISEVRLHLDMTYTVAVERTFRMINREFRKYEANTSVSHTLMKQILNIRTYEL